MLYVEISYRPWGIIVGVAESIFKFSSYNITLRDLYYVNRRVMCVSFSI